MLKADMMSSARRIPMDGTVDVTILVDARAAGELRDTRTRDAIGRLVSHVLQRQRQENVDLLFGAIEQLGADAEAKGMTDMILEEGTGRLQGRAPPLIVFDTSSIVGAVIRPGSPDGRCV
jgi:hypothetical protein